MVKVHFVDGTTLDINSASYQDLVHNLNKMTNAKFINFNDVTIVINNITYIEKVEVEA